MVSVLEQVTQTERVEIYVFLYGGLLGSVWKWFGGGRSHYIYIVVMMMGVCVCLLETIAINGWELFSLTHRAVTRYGYSRLLTASTCINFVSRIMSSNSIAPAPILGVENQI